VLVVLLLSQAFWRGFDDENPSSFTRVMAQNVLKSAAADEKKKWSDAKGLKGNSSNFSKFYQWCSSRRWFEWGISHLQQTKETRDIGGESMPIFGGDVTRPSLWRQWVQVRRQALELQMHFAFEKLHFLLQGVVMTLVQDEDTFSDFKFLSYT